MPSLTQTQRGDEWTDYAGRITRPSQPAQIIRSDEEAIEVARNVAREIGRDAAQRDRERRLPFAELDLVTQSGLWAITVPKAFGGAGVSYATLARVFAILSSADPAIGQLQQTHASTIHWLGAIGTDDQKAFFFGEILRGARFGNATAEADGPTTGTLRTRLLPVEGGYRLSARKAYATGSVFAHFLTVDAQGTDGQLHLAILDTDTPGLSIIDDWSSFGQRTTASGAVIVDDVFVAHERIVPLYKVYDGFPQGAVSQIAHAAIDIGIADAAVADTLYFVRNFSRAAREGGSQRASEDPHLLFQIGELEIRLHAAEAMLDRAGRAIDKALAVPDAITIGAASIAVAEVKVLAHEIAIKATNHFFELAGTRSTLAPNAFDRHWRNARVHTLHDAVRWKYHAVGNYYLNEANPDRLGTL